MFDIWFPCDMQRMIAGLTIAGADKPAAYHEALRDLAVMLALPGVAAMCQCNAREAAKETAPAIAVGA